MGEGGYLRFAVSEIPGCRRKHSSHLKVRALLDSASVSADIARQDILLKGVWGLGGALGGIESA